MHKDEFGLEAGDLLRKEKLLLHTHCTVASHLVIVRGTGRLVLMESCVGVNLNLTSSKPQRIQL